MLFGVGSGSNCLPSSLAPILNKGVTKMLTVLLRFLNTVIWDAILDES